MAATFEDIKRWFQTGLAQGAIYMIVKWDDFDFEDGDYPVYVYRVEDFWAEYDDGVDRVMESYDLRLSMEEQLDEFRAHHVPPRPQAKGD